METLFRRLTFTQIFRVSDYRCFPLVRKIELVEYNPKWVEMYEEEAASVMSALGNNAIRIHHIGSTAILGICAKPIIDILVEAGRIESIDSKNEAMIELGYEPRGEFGIPGRRYFSKGSDEKRTHHVHIFQVGDPQIEHHINFRDYLIAHPDKAKEYCKLKKQLAARYPKDVGSYTDEKSEFISDIDKKALEWVYNKKLVNLR
jgi:GrpB-like predicted nucleotidyltransferase (UPF0157 family)